MPTPHAPKPDRTAARPATEPDSKPHPPQTKEIELEVMELEERIAPRLATNHNERLLAER